MKRTATKSRVAAQAKAKGKGVRVVFDAEVMQLLGATARGQNRPVEKVIEGAVWEFLAGGSWIINGHLQLCSTRYSRPPFPRPHFHTAHLALGSEARKGQVQS